MFSISVGSTLSFGAWIRQRGSSTPMSMISAFGNVSAKTLQRGIEPPWPCVTTSRPYASRMAVVIASKPGPFSVPTNGSPSASRSKSTLTCQGATEARCSINAVCACFAFIPGGTRRLIRARASGWIAADEDVRVLAELIGRIRGPVPGLCRVQPPDRGVAVFVAERGQHGDQRRERVGRGTAEHSRVHRAGQRPYGHPDVGEPPQARGEAGHPDREVAGVANQDRVSTKQVSVLWHERLEAAGALLLRALADDLDTYRQVVAKGP